MRLERITEGLHDQVGQQFLAGGVYFLACIGFCSSLQGHGDVPTDAHIGNAGQIQVFHVVDHGFALWIEQFLVGHNVNFGDEFHGCSVLDGRKTGAKYSAGAKLPKRLVIAGLVYWFIDACSICLWDCPDNSRGLFKPRAIPILWYFAVFWLHFGVKKIFRV